MQRSQLLVLSSRLLIDLADFAGRVLRCYNAENKALGRVRHWFMAADLGDRPEARFRVSFAACTLFFLALGLYCSCVSAAPAPDMA